MTTALVTQPPIHAVRLPSRFTDHTPSTTVYIRRRVLVAAVAAAICSVLWLSVGNVLANRGGAPASTSTVRPALQYVVQPGDTLWSIAQVHHGAVGLDHFVELLIAANGGRTQILAGQLLAVP